MACAMIGKNMLKNSLKNSKQDWQADSKREALTTILLMLFTPIFIMLAYFFFDWLFGISPK